MILEVEDETRDFVTIYGQDFQPKRIERSKQYRPIPNYPPPLNILNGPYKKYLNTRGQNLLLPINERSEDPQENLNRIRNKYKPLKKFLPETLPDEDLIERTEKEITSTAYQLDYSKDVYSPRTRPLGKAKKPVTLPQDLVVTETIQRKSYKNPWKIATEGLLRIKRMSKPADNLKPNLNERNILFVRTGDSEYNGTIDATGNDVIEKCLFGKPLPLEPQVHTKLDSPESEWSQIRKSKYLVLPSRIF